MEFRLSRNSDLETLSSWFDNETDARYWGGPSIRFPINIANLKNDIQWSENQSYSLIENGSLVGFAQIANRFDCNHLCRILIKPNERGRNLGKKLMEFIFDTLKSDTKIYSLFVYKDNEIAINLYKNIGFHIKPHPEGQSHMIECLFMIKNITK